MICPFMTKDPVNSPIPCVDSCGLRFKGMCSINVLAQSKYQEYIKEHGEPKTEIQSETNN